jgi:beta-lactamase superfamily II metal-dependent hydrolase
MATPKSKAKGELRIRMYRVGFGDFFLVTIPSAAGPQHILIDCGVTPGKTKKGDIGTIKDAVAHMAEETGKKLALIIATHRHQDHIIGFSRCADVFKDFEVGAVWMSIWETEYDPDEKKETKKKSLALEFQDALTSMAFDMQQHLALAGADDPDMQEAAAMLENATGIDRAMLAAAGGADADADADKAVGKGGGTNAKSLEMLKTGFGVEPEYYAKGDKPKLPKALRDAGLTAEILGPPPLDEGDFLKLMDLKKGVGQFLGASSGGGTGGKFDPFGESAHVKSEVYPQSAFREWTRESAAAPNKALQAVIQAAQPSLLFTAAKTLNDFLNNQSVVVLFTFAGTKMLFAGDAQGGNWEYWMFGGTPVKVPSVEDIDKKSKSILQHLDFYKMGHHGSTNATPVTAVELMDGNFLSLCSTQEDSFGTVENDSEVPRIAADLRRARSSSTTFQQPEPRRRRCSPGLDRAVRSLPPRSADAAGERLFVASNACGWR